MKYSSLPFLLFFLNVSHGQQLRLSELIGLWTTTSYPFLKWDFKENTTIEFPGSKSHNRNHPAFEGFSYYIDSIENNLRIVQYYGEVTDTVFFYKIQEAKINSIRLNLYKKIPYSRTLEKPKKEIIIPNGGTIITLQRKTAI